MAGNAKIGAPKKDIFASHWEDTNPGDNRPALPGRPKLAQAQPFDISQLMKLAIALQGENGVSQGADPMAALSKAGSIGAPQGKDIFASHWQDTDMDGMEPDGDPDDVSYAKAFHKALAGRPAPNVGGMRPIMGGVVEGNGLPKSPSLGAALKAPASQAKINFSGDLPGAELGDEMLPDSTAPLTALNIQPNPLPQKKGKFSRFGGALKHAILGR